MAQFGIFSLAPNKRANAAPPVVVTPPTVDPTPPTVTVDSTGKIHTGRGLVPGSAFIVSGTLSGTTKELGRSVAGTDGVAVVTLARFPATGSVFTYVETRLGSVAPKAGIDPDPLPEAPPPSFYRTSFFPPLI